MDNVLRTPPELPIIWSLGLPATGHVDVPWTSLFRTFEYLFLPVKNSNRCVKQGLLHLKNAFFIKSSTFVLVP